MTKAQRFSGGCWSYPKRTAWIIETIWSSLDNPDALPLPSWQRDLLDERRASLETEEGQDWEDVKAEIWPPTR